MNGKSRERGFTLVEVIVVVAVIAILAAILTPYITKYIDDSRVAKARNEAQVIGAAAASFYKDLGRWPNANLAATNFRGVYAGNKAPTAALINGQAGWVGAGANWNSLDTHFNTNGHALAYLASGEQRWNGPYATELPVDPWGNAYLINAYEFQNPLGLNPPPPVWVISAGPNGKLDTPAASLIALVDDVGFRIR